jgi:hypothetical protein
MSSLHRTLSQNGITPLLYAASGGHVTPVKRYVPIGADLTATDMVSRNITL